MDDSVFSRFAFNNLKPRTKPLNLHNYFSPLTSQVEELETNTEAHDSALSITTPTSAGVNQHVTFTLPAGHTDKDSTEWRRSPRSRSKRPTAALPPKQIQVPPLTEADLKRGVLNGTIASAAWDTACTSNAGKVGDPYIQTSVPSTKVFAVADGHRTPASNVAKLHHNIREPARTVDMVPALADQSLLSGGKFAEAGYISICDGEEVNIYDGRTARIEVSEAAVLRGWRCPRSKLWRVPLQAKVTNLNAHTLLLDGPNGTESLNSLYSLPSSTTMLNHIEAFTQGPTPSPVEAINNVYELPSIEPAIRYLHGAAGFPPKATWIKAIRNGNYLTWPLLTVKNVNKYFPESEETQKGHMRNQRQGVRSTKVKTSPATQTPTPQKISPITTAAGGAAQISSAPNTQHPNPPKISPITESAGGAAQIPDVATETPAIEEKKDIFISTYKLRDTMFTDQTGKFPHSSSRGNNYQMVIHEIDSNSTWVEPMKNRTEGEMILARRRALTRMHLQGIIPKHQVLDNEISAAYKAEILATDMTYQLVPPDDHRRNIAEKAIQTWKDHFVGVLSGAAASFPMHLWCQTIPQVERQLLLLRQSNVNPKISAYAHVYGPHNYDAAPFVPIGMESLVHDKPRRRKTFAEHCRKGYVLGTSFEHYRCWSMWMKDSRATRISATVFHKHKYISNPTVTAADAVIAAASNLAAVLKGKLPQHLKESSLNELTRLSTIFSQAATGTSEPPAIQQAKPSESPTKLPATNPHRRSPRLTTTVTKNGLIAASPRQPIAAPKNPPIPPPRQHITAPQPPSPRVLPPPKKLRMRQPAPRVEAPRRSPRLAAQAPRVETTVDEEDESQDDQRKKLPAYNTRSKNPNFRSIAQEAMLSCADVSQLRVTPQNLASRSFPMEMINAVLDEDTGELMEYRHLMKSPKYRQLYGKSYAKELGRLAQGMPGQVEGTNTIFFIDKADIPTARWRDVTYGRVVVNYRPEKDDPYRTRLTVGGDRVNYPHDCGTPTVDLLTVKLLLNSVVSTPGAKFMTIDIKDFYLNTPMSRYEYMRLKLSDLPEDFVKEYNLASKVTKDGYVYVEIRRGMYGLPQSGLLAQQLLEKRLNAEGYHQSELTPGFWTHEWRPVSFSLCVDDFGVKYTGKQHADHLMSVLKKHYAISQDWEGKRYLGLDLDWDYTKRQVHLSMLNYVADAIKRFHHEQPRKPEDQPYPHVKPNYGAKTQYATNEDTSPLLSKADKKFVQEVTGTFLYYARAVDTTMLTALGSIATQQANPTENTMKKVKQFLDYAASHPDAIVTYHASDMVLAGHSDASYLSETKARSRAGGHFFMSSNTSEPPNNGAVITIAQIIKAVMSSAAEAELGALFINCREAIPARHALEEMGHKQPPTPMQTDNTTALGVVTNNIASKRLKSMDMKFHWLRCRAAQGQFRHYWRPGPTNLGDYVTKHHAAIHHRATRGTFLTPKFKLDLLRKRNQHAAAA